MTFRLPALVLALLLSAASAQTETPPGPDDILYVPDNLKGAVAFWETIYRRVRTDQGLIHDGDSFRVVYDTLDVGKGHSRARTRQINAIVDAHARLLRQMARTDRALWSDTLKAEEAFWGRTLDSIELEKAANRVRFQLGQADRFLTGIKRSGRYLDKIQRVFTEYGLPEELAYLPHVESSFNYKAYSKVGAAGIWQFMRSTGRLYLKVGYVIDERLDPVKSTVAAAKLLSSNYRRLKSWPLAITAYNHGPNSVAAAVAQLNTTDIGVITENYQRKSFQFASKNFYPSFVAAYRTASAYQEHFGDVAFDPPFECVDYELQKSYRPSYLATALGIPPAELQEYNLAIRPPVFKNNQYLPKGYLIKLPMEFASLDIDSLLGTLPAGSGLASAPGTGVHKTRKGESLTSVAARYHLEVDELASVNNLDMNARIKPGQILALPGGGSPAEARKAVTEVEIARKSKARADTASTTEIASAIPAPASAPEPPAVKKPAAIQPSTAPAPSPVPESLVTAAIPGYLRAEKTTAPVLPQTPLPDWDYLYHAFLALTPRMPPPKCPICEFDANFYDLGFEKESGDQVSVRVQIDETLGHLAEWSGVPSDRIRAANRMSSQVYFGKLIDIPMGPDSAAQFLNRRLEYHLSIEEDFFNNYEVSGMDTLDFKAGGNLWALSQEYDIPLWLLLKANPRIQDLRTLRPGPVLMPVVTEKNGKTNGAPDTGINGSGKNQPEKIPAGSDSR